MSTKHIPYEKHKFRLSSEGCKSDNVWPIKLQPWRCISMILGCKLNGQKKHLTDFNCFSDTANGPCEPITIPLCQEDLAYTETLMPSLLGHATQEEVGIALKQHIFFRYLLKISFFTLYKIYYQWTLIDPGYKCVALKEMSIKNNRIIALSFIMHEHSLYMDQGYKCVALKVTAIKHNLFYFL